MLRFFKKLNKTGLRDIIQKLRILIKAVKYFKKRTYWNCNKDLNLYIIFLAKSRILYIF